MASLAEIRQKYPQYNDMSDAALADAIYGKFYADMPRDQFNAKIGYEPMSVGEDVARSVATGAGEAVHGVAGAVGDLFGAGMQIGRWVDKNILGNEVKSPGEIAGANPLAPITSQAMESYTGFDQHKHVPQTTAGEFARTAAEFATPVAPFGLRAATKFGLVPGAVSEAAGQLTEGSDFEPIARVLGGVGGAGVMAFLSRPSTAAAALKKAMPKGVTNNDIMRADSLMAEGRRQGVQLTWPEALHQVTNGRVDVTGLQRLVEQTKGGAPVMAPIMADRPAQVNRAMGDAMDDLSAGARMTSPEAAGLGIQRTAEGGLNDIRRQINAVAEPYYNAAAGTRIPAAQLQRLQADPLYQDALRAVRTDPIHSRAIRNLPDDSIGVQNEIKKHFDRLADRAAPQGDKTAAGVYGTMGREVRDTARAASPDYDRALGLESDLRQRFLNPAEAGPLGKLARTEDIAAQGRALLAGAPVEGSEQAVRATVRLLAQRAPDQAAQLVRTHLRSAFDEATQNLIAGGNQWGGAKFAAAIRGNGQQARNLEAAVRALPNGDARWEGLQAFLEVMEATGKRQRPGSLTAFNAEALNDLKRGGLPTEAARTARSLGTRLFEFYDQWKLGKNTEELARIITDPRSGQMLAKLAGARTPNQRAAMAGYLITFYAPKTEAQPPKQINGPH